jgi:hypothetical protein
MSVQAPDCRGERRAGPSYGATTDCVNCYLVVTGDMIVGALNDLVQRALSVKF